MEQTQHPFQLLPRRTFGRGAVQPAILEAIGAILLIPFRPALKRPHANPKNRGSLLLRDLAPGLSIQKTLKTHPTYSLVNSCRSHFVPPCSGHLRTRQITSYKHTSDHELATTDWRSPSRRQAKGVAFESGTISVTGRRGRRAWHVQRATAAAKTMLRQFWSRGNPGQPRAQAYRVASCTKLLGATML
jgi:hypothetical protein